MTMSMYEKILAVTDRKLCTRPFPEQIRRVCGCRPKAPGPPGKRSDAPGLPGAGRAGAGDLRGIPGGLYPSQFYRRRPGAGREADPPSPEKNSCPFRRRKRRPSPASALPCIPRNRPVRLWRRGLPGCLPATFTKASARRDCLPEAWNF